jgi:hypothetical protein
MPKFTADLTNNLRGGIQVLLKRDRLHSRTCPAHKLSGDIKEPIMANVIEATYEETEARNRNQPYRIFTPLRSRKYTERLLKKTSEKASSHSKDDKSSKEK